MPALDDGDLTAILGNQAGIRDHHCHAKGCKVACAPEALMCLNHWRMVPKDKQRAVWRTYNKGQCYARELVTPAWLTAACAAIAAVAEKEGRAAPGADSLDGGKR